MSKVNSIAVLAEMCERNGPIYSAGPSNIIEVNKRKMGDEVTIGLPHGEGFRLLSGEVVVSLIWADKRAFDELKGELERDPGPEAGAR